MGGDPVRHKERTSRAAVVGGEAPPHHEVRRREHRHAVLAQEALGDVRREADLAGGRQLRLVDGHELGDERLQRRERRRPAPPCVEGGFTFKETSGNVLMHLGRAREESSICLPLHSPASEGSRSRSAAASSMPWTLMVEGTMVATVSSAFIAPMAPAEERKAQPPGRQRGAPLEGTNVTVSHVGGDCGVCGTRAAPLRAPAEQPPKRRRWPGVLPIP